MISRLSLCTPLVLFTSFSLFAQQPSQTALDSMTRAQLHGMLHMARTDVEKYYYDPHFHGVDLDAVYKKSDTRLDSVQTLNQGFTVIAAFLQSLKDSHTFFEPPRRIDRSQSGFMYQMVGDKCFITHVQPKTDAATKVHPGDQILSYDSFKPERSTATLMEYYFSTIATTKASALTLLAPDGKTRHEVVENKVVIGKRATDFQHDYGGNELFYYRHLAQREGELDKPRFLDAGSVLVWKQPIFSLAEAEMDSIFAHRVDKHAALVLDLRDNPGGSVEVLKQMLGHVFDHEVTVATLDARKTEKPIVAKPRGNLYRGPLTVLIDSQSSSAAELFARVIQLEHRGKVMGDRSSGLVMEAEDYDEVMGVNEATYSFSITHANLIMTDGHSLENAGVIPDELLIPTAQDLAEGNDSVLEKAVTEAGGTYDAKAAAKALPFLWPPNDTD